MEALKMSRANQLKNDPDYKEAWRACNKTLDIFGKSIDMHKLLAAVIKDGWSPQALKAYAWCHHLEERYDAVTPTAWRRAIYSVGAKYSVSQAPKFLAQFNNVPDMRSRFAHVMKQPSKQPH
jgi:hypothetical protein